MNQVYETTPWEPSVVKKYLTATSQEKDDPETFYKTHLDIDRIYAEHLPSITDEDVTQEQFRDELLAADIDEKIRTFILRGETGAGKSQLCQWLDYELQGLGEAQNVDDRVPLHIKANETSLDDIISTLAEPLGVDPEVAQVGDLDPEMIADAIIGNLRASPGQKLKDVDIEALADPNRGDLASILETNIERYQRGLEESDETDFDPNLISKDDYRDISLRLGTDSAFHTDKEILRRTLRDEIHRHFSHLIGVDDFQGQLRDYTTRIVEELGKRPVIICEDVTTFSVLKEQLLDQIIQVESGTFDIILGYTTGFEQDDLDDALANRGSEDALTYLKDRAEGYLSLTENGEALFLDDDLSVELVGKYLSVIKAESGGDVPEDLEGACSGLYPFNPAFVRRAYANLLEEGSPRRTPRVLLQKVVRRCLLSEKQPYEVVETSPNIDDVVSAVDPQKYDSELQHLATWYGTKHQDDSWVLVHVRLLEEFGFEASEVASVTEVDGEPYAQFESNSAAEMILSNFRQSTSGPRPTDSTSETDSPEDELKTEPEGDSDVSPDSESDTPDVRETSPDDPETRRLKQQLKEFYDWVSTGDDYDSSGVLRSGAEDLLNMWHDPTRLANHNTSARGVDGIYYKRGQNVPVSIQGPDERSGLDVTLPFGDKYTSLYTGMLRLEIDGELPNDVNVQQLKSWATNAVVGFRGDMREAIEDCLPPEMTIEHTLLFAHYLLSNAEHGNTAFDLDAVFESSDPSDREYDNPLVSMLGKRHGLREALQDLQMRRSDIEGLIEGFFLLKKNVVDHDRLRDARRDIANDPRKYLQLAQQIDTERLSHPDAYRIGSTRSEANVRLTVFLDAISEFSVEVSMFDDGLLQEHFEQSLNPVKKWHDASHTVADLEEAFDRLSDCLGTFNEAQKERWDEAHTLVAEESQSVNLTEFQEDVADFVDPNVDSPFERLELLHRFEQSRHNHVAWDIYKALDEMIEALSDYDVDESSDLKVQLEQLRQTSDYETHRADITRELDRY